MRKVQILIALLLFGVYVPSHVQSCAADTQAAFIARGNTALEDKDYTEALADYNCALDINPSNTNALFGRAYSYDKLGKFTEAEADYKVLLALDPNRGGAYNNRGNLYYEQGDYVRARSDYDIAISLPNDDKYIPYYNRGNLSYQEGDYAAALQDLNASLNLDDTYESAYLSRAAVYQTLGDTAALMDILKYVNLIRIRTIDQTAPAQDTGETLGMSEGSVYDVSFQVQAGQIVRAAARTEAEADVDPLLVLLGPDGEAVEWDDDSGVNLDAVLRYTIPADGTYTLLITHAGGGSEGEVTLSLDISGHGTADLNGALADIFRVYSLAVNDQATVFASGGDHLNLRSGPGLDFDILAKLDRDASVTLLEGPRKNDGYNWWRIQTSVGQEGWAVERVVEEQTLHPALEVGGQAVVTTINETLRVRDGAGTNFNVLVELPDGAIVTLLDGPERSDNYSWWKIRTEDGLEGWAAESIRTVRTLARYTDADARG